MNKVHLDITTELQFVTSRSGGKGGQNVNKVETKVTARWHLPTSVLCTEEQKSLIQNKLANKISEDGYLQVNVSENRTQLANKISAIKKINEWVNQALVVKKKRKKAIIPAAVKEARLKAKKIKSEIKQGRSKNIDY